MSWNISERKCIICGKTYIPKSGVQKQCNSAECKAIHHRNLNRKSAHKIKYDNKNSISLICEKARERGISYGQYVGLCYAGKI